MEKTIDKLEQIKLLQEQLSNVGLATKDFREKWDKSYAQQNDLSIKLLTLKFEAAKDILKSFEWELIFSPNYRRREDEKSFANIKVDDFDLFTNKGYRNSDLDQLFGCRSGSGTVIGLHSNRLIEATIWPTSTVIGIHSNFTTFEDFIREYSLKVNVRTAHKEMKDILKMIEKIGRYETFDEPQCSFSG